LEAFDTLDLLVALGVTATRAEAAREIARRCGVEAVVPFVRDREVGALIPASGFDQTLAGGASWRHFLRRCMEPGTHAARVEFPKGTERGALCITLDAMALVFLGGTPDRDAVAEMLRGMPLICQAFAAEQQARFARAKADAALAAAGRARALADALEAARAEHARLNAKLHEEHERKDHFLAMLAHELRNPLTPLVTSIELIRRADGRASEKHLDIMARQTRHLSRLVEDLLDVSRVSRGRIELRRQRLPLCQVVAEALEASRPFLESRRHRVEMNAEDATIHVDADNVRLSQVFANLLHNAGKYTDAGGFIRIWCGCEGGEAVVRVQDNGVGIDPSMRGSVFDLFTQAPMSLERAQGGLGIGLTLVKALVELHEGRVDVESEGLGKGSTFTVRLPLAPGPAYRRPATAPAPKEAGSDQRPLRVLVVDDNEDAATSMAEILRLMGHHVEVAFSGLRAMHMAEDVEPDLVMLDIGLPEIDGYEVARRLRLSARRPVRLVAVTGYGAEKDKALARDAGFDEHVVKPVMPDSLQGILERVRAADVAMNGP
jgi:signal transduction histidine kinase/ActR/RegA family two-component response regulator